MPEKEERIPGGARSDADGPLPGTTPLALLWQFLAQRCGPELAEEAHRYFNEQQRHYQQWRRDEEIRARRKSAAMEALTRHRLGES